jgi:hypothetical protein
MKFLPWSPKVEKTEIIICLTISEVRIDESLVVEDEELTVAWWFRGRGQVG